MRVVAVLVSLVVVRQSAEPGPAGGEGRNEDVKDMVPFNFLYLAFGGFWFWVEKAIKQGKEVVEELGMNTLLDDGMTPVVSNITRLYLTCDIVNCTKFRTLFTSSSPAHLPPWRQAHELSASRYRRRLAQLP